MALSYVYIYACNDFDFPAASVRASACIWFHAHEMHRANLYATTRDADTHARAHV